MPLLVGFSMLRDELPWLYELATQFSRAFETGNAGKAHRIGESIVHMIEMLHHSPMGEMLGIRDDDSMMILHQLERLVDRHLHEMMPPSRTTAARRKPAKTEPKSAE